jgi:hypothetical protein
VTSAVAAATSFLDFAAMNVSSLRSVIATDTPLGEETLMGLV